MPVKEHEPGPPLPGGGRRCTICGAPLGNGYNYTCLAQRPGDVPRARLPSGVDDAATISSRLAELRAERDAVRALPGDEA